MGEWAQAEAVVDQTFKAIAQIEQQFGANEKTKANKIVINGSECIASKPLWSYVIATLTRVFIDAAAKYYSPETILNDEPPKQATKLDSIFMDKLWDTSSSFDEIMDFSLTPVTFSSTAPLLVKSDLAKKPYKYILNSSKKAAEALIKDVNKKKERAIKKAFTDTNLIDVNVLEDFINTSWTSRLDKVRKAKRTKESLLPYFFPTRPLTPPEIAELVPECVGLIIRPNKDPSSIWANYVRALKGVWVKPSLLETDDEVKKVELQDKLNKKQEKKDDTRIIVKVGNKETKTIIVAISSLYTSDSSWVNSICGKPDLSLNRYKRISQLINQYHQSINFTLKLNTLFAVL